MLLLTDGGFLGRHVFIVLVFARKAGVDMVGSVGDIIPIIISTEDARQQKIMRPHLIQTAGNDSTGRETGGGSEHDDVVFDRSRLGRVGY